MIVIRTGNGTPAEPTITSDNRPAQKMNPVGTFRAKSECINPSSCDSVSFEWSLVCIKPDLEDPIDYTDLDNYDNITLSDNPEQQPSKNLRVNRKLRWL